MPQAARSLRRSPHREPPARLRAVPPPRGPSRAVIRRRRAVALAALAFLVAFPIGLLTTGGAGSDSERITELLAAGASQPATLCDHLSSGMLQAIGGHDACVAASPERAPAGDVQDVRISGDSASAIVVRDTGEERVELVRQDGDWKIDDVR